MSQDSGSDSQEPQTTTTHQADEAGDQQMTDSTSDADSGTETEAVATEANTDGATTEATAEATEDMGETPEPKYARLNFEAVRGDGGKIIAYTSMFKPKGADAAQHVEYAGDRHHVLNESRTYHVQLEPCIFEWATGNEWGWLATHMDPELPAGEDIETTFKSELLGTDDTGPVYTFWFEDEQGRKVHSNEQRFTPPEGFKALVHRRYRYGTRDDGTKFLSSKYRLALPAGGGILPPSVYSTLQQSVRSVTFYPSCRGKLCSWVGWPFNRGEGPVIKLRPSDAKDAGLATTTAEATAAGLTTLEVEDAASYSTTKLRVFVDDNPRGSGLIATRLPDSVASEGALALYVKQAVHPMIDLRRVREIRGAPIDANQKGELSREDVTITEFDWRDCFQLLGIEPEAIDEGRGDAVIGELMHTKQRLNHPDKVKRRSAILQAQARANYLLFSEAGKRAKEFLAMRDDGRLEIALANQACRPIDWEHIAGLKQAKCKQPEPKAAKPQKKKGAPKRRKSRVERRKALSNQPQTSAKEGGKGTPRRKRGDRKPAPAKAVIEQTPASTATKAVEAEPEITYHPELKVPMLDGKALGVFPLDQWAQVPPDQQRMHVMDLDGVPDDRREAFYATLPTEGGDQAAS